MATANDRARSGTPETHVPQTGVRPRRILRLQRRRRVPGIPPQLMKGPPIVITVVKRLQWHQDLRLARQQRDRQHRQRIANGEDIEPEPPRAHGSKYTVPVVVVGKLRTVLFRYGEHVLAAPEPVKLDEVDSKLH